MAFETDPPHILTADDIWNAQDIEESTVEVPQWHGSVRIKTFSKRQVDAMNRRATVKDRFGKESVDTEAMEALIFCEGVIEPTFEPEDYDRLRDKSAIAVSTILKAILNASGLSVTAVTDADKSTEPESRAALRVLSGSRAQDDAGGIVATDVGT